MAVVRPSRYARRITRGHAHRLRRARRPATRCCSTAADPDRPHRAGHPEQLRPRRDALGHLPHLRGELQRATSSTAPGRVPAAAAALRHQRARASATAGTSTTRGSTPRCTRTSRTGSAGWSRSIPTTRVPAGEAHRARALQARGRRGRPGDGRPGRRLHGRRRALRVHLQVRQPGRLGAVARPRGRDARCSSSGTLYVARFDADGAGEWLRAEPRRQRARRRRGLRLGQADDAGRTRGAPPTSRARTKMDRPEWIAVHPATGEVYCTLTNNTARRRRRRARRRRRQPARRTTCSATSSAGASGRRRRRPPVRVGRVRAGRRPRPRRRRASAATSRATCSARPTGSGSTRAACCGSRPTCRRACSTAATTRAWATTRCWRPIPPTREIRRFLTGPNGCEITGIIIHAGRPTLFVNIQHPGETASERSNPGGAAGGERVARRAVGRPPALGHGGDPPQRRRRGRRLILRTASSERRDRQDRAQTLARGSDPGATRPPGVTHPARWCGRREHVATHGLSTAVHRSPNRLSPATQYLPLCNQGATTCGIFCV